MPVAAVRAVEAARLIKSLGTPKTRSAGLEIGLFLVVGSLGLFENGGELLALDEDDNERLCQGGTELGILGRGKGRMQEAGSMSYSADDLSRIVDDGNGLFQRHGGLGVAGGMIRTWLPEEDDPPPSGGGEGMRAEGGGMRAGLIKVKRRRGSYCDAERAAKTRRRTVYMIPRRREA